MMFILTDIEIVKGDGDSWGLLIIAHIKGAGRGVVVVAANPISRSDVHTGVGAQVPAFAVLVGDINVASRFRHTVIDALDCLLEVTVELVF